MRIFLIADLHLGLDPRVEKPMDIFDELWVDHENRIKEEWLSKVKDEDYVIIGGDISWGLKLEEAMLDLKFIENLPGTKIIFKGNHDLWWQTRKKLREAFPNPKMIFMQNDSYFIPNFNGKSLAICGSRGWVCPGNHDFTIHDEKVYLSEVIRLRMSLEDGKKNNPDRIIAIMHYPPTNDKKQMSDFTKLLSEYNVEKCYYGHLHGKENFNRGLTGILNGTEYRLISYDYLMGKMEEIK